MASIKVARGMDNGSLEGIAANSLAIANGDAVSLSGGFVVKTTASTGRIVGFANGTKTYTSDNQTVAKAKVNFLVAEPNETIVEFPVSAASLAQTDVGKYYLLNSSQQVDVTTGRAFRDSVNTSDGGVAADPVTNYQVQLVEFISTSRGRFAIV